MKQQIDLTAYLGECRDLVLEEIGGLLPTHEPYRSVLYELMLDYPRRHAKALRPALCIATCRALGGHLDSVLRSAAVLELYHNAFLIHDDVEDGSESRRDRPTLHREHGVPIAVNVGDGMLALALQPLLDNMRLLGLGRALRVLQVVARMARESVEGQAIELDWIRHGRWALDDSHYVRMVYKKTSWYTFVAPMWVGAIVANVDGTRIAALRRFAGLLGVAFQIHDDILNLVAERARYGKEIEGDLWEGKHTAILLHALRSATPSERERAVAILRKARPVEPGETSRARNLATVRETIRRLDRERLLHGRARAALEAAVERARAGVQSDAGKTVEDVRFLRRLIDRYGSIPHARELARVWADKAARALRSTDAWLVPSVHRDFLTAIGDFVTDRDW
jgi:geranylgeranyl diphosphate synthase type II